MSFRSTVAHLIETRGSTEEQQLLRRWRPDLEAFMSQFGEGLQKGHQRLEIGLENKLVLKLVVKRHLLPPVTGLLRILDQLPPLPAAAGRLAISLGADFHVGLRMQADRCHREIYIYDAFGKAFSQLIRTHQEAPPLPSAMTVTAYGFDELTGLSAYFTTQKNPRIKAQLPGFADLLTAELKIDVRARLVDVWEHLRLEDGQWRPGKFGIELQDVPLEMAARILSHYRPPHFRYLVPFKAYSSIVLAGTPDSGIRAWYFTN